MKLNGLTRIKMPATENVELISRVKKIYDLHLLIDNLMGDKLHYDQFHFIYNNITFIFESNIREEISIFKEKNFMEDAIPKYIILSALKNSVIVLNKMKSSLKAKNEVFSQEAFYQITQMKLGSDENYILNAFEHTEATKKLAQSMEETIEKLHNEIKEFGGRFWILEEFFNPEDAGLWLEAVEMLKDINLTVIDDIRDFILTNYEHTNPQHQNDDHNNISAKKETRKDIMRKGSTIKLMSQKSVKKLKDLNYKSSPATKPKKPAYKVGSNALNLNQDNKGDKSDLSEDDSVIVANSKTLANMNLENLRPPFVWNFPIEQILSKRSKESEKKAEVRNVDPKNFYKDGRITQFLEILSKIKVKMIEFCRTSKPNKWLYFVENVLKIHGITYAFADLKPLVEEPMNEKTD